GPRDQDIQSMLKLLGSDSLDALVDSVMPDTIRSEGGLSAVPAACGEMQALDDLRDLASQNQVLRSYIGLGYHDCITPPVILRTILENPGWYTQYTPYQAEISQGRLEALLTFQTMVIDLTGMAVANCSLLDEATAAAEAMTMCRRVLGKKAQDRNVFFVSNGCHPQTLEVVMTRAQPLGIEVLVGDPAEFEFGNKVFGALLQYPNTDGSIDDLTPFCEKAHAAGALVTVATDLLALTLLKAPGELGADVVVGNSQRFGVPMGYGGPHAAFMGARDDYKRQLPGRIIGVTIDATGRPALRMALQTREQHIRRDKATSNICTAQVLLAIVAATYAVYHGPEGLTAIARRTRGFTGALAKALTDLGCTVHNGADGAFFDTLRVTPGDGNADRVLTAALALGINLREFGDDSVGIAFDETVDAADVADVYVAFGGKTDDLDARASVTELPDKLRRTSGFLTHPVFHRYRSETELLRYLARLQSKDLSLTTSMIPLGSCTMKLNATAEMIPITWPEFSKLHPFAPLDQANGYQELHRRLCGWLNDITGFAACSLQPNAGSQGEYTGLLTIRAYHRANGEEQRDVCLIPSSAHGTNPASAIMAGMRVVVVNCDDAGNIDLQDLSSKAAKHGHDLAALMVTYPSTHGVFEATIKNICAIVHEHGGQVYLDGANLNAMVGFSKPGDLGADVCHLNLHKTFCIPHGGGGPGMGPICAAAHLAPFLPGHPLIKTGGDQAIGAVAAAPWGSPSILPISYAYIAMMGPEGLEQATQVAILNANYIAQRLQDHYPVLYTGQNGRVAHECILDVRPLKQLANVDVADVAKRLMDFGFHAPTMSWPVAGTLMVEPTESESKEELDRFCDAMIKIREEAQAIADGEMDRDDNPLKNAPHTAEVVSADSWDHPYSREQAAYPTAWTREYKYWPPVSRVNDVHG
ncbi:MAG: aminomethyl-transferring glycine dehydrogenase, partial [Planctomycetota bacterium]